MNIFQRSVAVMLLVISPATFAAFSQVISFGDSLSDNGNILAATGGAAPIAPNLPGRFSNGQTWNELLASKLGLPALVPGVSNFAFGGALTDSTASLGQPSANAQIAGYLAATGGVADPNAIYTVLIGGNDINAKVVDVATAIGGGADAATEIGAGAADMAALAGTLGTSLGNLLAAGAQNILLVNVPNVGLTPSATLAGASAIATPLSQGFNAGLDGVVAALSNPAITYFDAFALTNDIAANPGTYGLTNVTDACWNEVTGPGEVVCPNPDDYLFWDGIHPTAEGHEIVANAALAAIVPVPAALPLFLTAVAGLGILRRKAA